MPSAYNKGGLESRAAFSLHIDYDSTLFDTARFAEDLWIGVSGLTGVLPDRVRTDSRAYYADARLGGYDYVTHMQTYGMDGGRAVALLDDVLSGRDYLYPDSLSFIRDLRADGFEPAILSFGEQMFQGAKIDAINRALAPSDRPLDVHIVLERKAEYIAKAFAGRQGALVDDIPKQNLPAGFTEIHVERDRGLTVPQPVEEGYVVSSLTQARTVLLDIENHEES